ncbi:MAG: Ryanodine receptor Ryr [Clostridia bacterium]|nr:Ryanodine receptor Ryr [Clostridia bacterium]
MKYHPEPIDTSGITLPEELSEILEVLSENMHEIWAKARIEDGWSHGPRRSDKQLHSQLLVPYEDLPESEKKYDRAIVENLLKTLFKLGFDIVGKDPGKNSHGA